MHNIAIGQRACEAAETSGTPSKCEAEKQHCAFRASWHSLDCRKHSSARWLGVCVILACIALSGIFSHTLRAHGLADRRAPGLPECVALRVKLRPKAAPASPGAAPAFGPHVCPACARPAGPGRPAGTRPVAQPGAAAQHACSSSCMFKKGLWARLAAQPVACLGPLVLTLVFLTAHVGLPHRMTNLALIACMHCRAGLHTSHCAAWHICAPTQH